MKKLLLVFFLGLTIMSCSDDDENIPYIDSKIAAKNEIKIIFEATKDNSKAIFYLKGENYEVDWGDGQTLTSNTNTESDELSHTYDNLKEYIITIKCDQEIKQFSNVPINYSYPLWVYDSSFFKRISIGDNIEINTLGIQQSGIEAIDINPNAEIDNTHILLDKMNEKADIPFEGKTDYLHVNIPYSRESVNISNIESSGINIMLEEGSIINSLKIESCKNKNLFIYTNNGNKGNYSSLKNLVLENLSELTKFEIYYSSLDRFDMSKANASMTFWMGGINIKEAIVFDSKISEIYVFGFISERSKTDLKVMDISMCENLKKLVIEDLESLESIITSDKNKALEIVGINQLNKMSKIKNLNFSNMPKLNYLQFDGLNKTDVLETLDISNSPSLKDLVIYNTNMKEIISSNNPLLESVRIDNNNIPEANLMNFITKLNDNPLASEKKRNLSVYGNPGNTAKLKEEGDKLSNWTIYYSEPNN